MLPFLRPVLVLALALGTACQPYHLPGGGADDGPQIGDRGISVPVPPPSLTLAPRQEVDVEGEVGDPSPAEGTEVFLLEAVTGDGYFVLANPDGTFLFEGIELDLTSNCIEVWTEVGNEMSVHSFFRARIAADDQTVITEQYFSGC